ncbi:MAG: DeoR/GlpR family DNA-binding transcription regulator [Eubacterium sp.]|nr:DeoR/GlpR family DNA-binding transcription regulator [Eubacterium sp.]
MLSHERYVRIQEIVNEKGTVTVAELSKELDTSESTIRRDLTALDELGKIKKFFGGATIVEAPHRFLEDTIRVKESLMNEEKTAIGKYAATLISDDDFVFIDAGTTTARMIDFIEKNNATYVTNGITHARKLLEKGLNTYIIGGKIKTMTEAIIGVEAIANLAKFNFSKAFIGVNGIDLKAGYTTPDIDEGLLKETAINQSNMVFVLADHSKFKKIFAKTFKELNQCCIITDSLPDPRYSHETVIKIVK